MNKIALSMLLLLTACSSTPREKEKIIDFRSLKIIKGNEAKLEDLGKMVRVIKLQTKTNSLIGSVDKVMMDKNGDLVIGDFRTTKQVLRFDNQGTFINKYSQQGQGPGEYPDLINFSITGQGDIILLTGLKLIKLSRDGHLLKETRINFYPGYIESIDDSLYISIFRYRQPNEKKNAIIILNPFFVRTGGVGKYDPRLENYLFALHNCTAKSEKSLFFLDYYDLTINIYDTVSQELLRLPFPCDNTKLEKTWQKKHFTQEDDQEILTYLHRFNDIFYFDGRLLLFEIHNASNTYNIWLLDLEKKEARVFKQSSLLGDFQVKEKQGLYFNRVAGVFEKGIICVFDDVENFNRYKAGFPETKDIEFNAEDNPILVFFEFKK